MERFKVISKKKINDLPQTAGVYCFASPKRGREDGLLYIGKAVNLKKRVKQHRESFSRTGQLGFIETGSEIDALLLEAKLIKKHRPKYNVAWKDDKNYFYVAIGTTDKHFPRVFITHQTGEKCSRYIGPFVDGRALKQALRVLRKVFPYYTARKHPAKPCLWCHLKLCPGPAPDKKEYRKNIKNLTAVLMGERGFALHNLKKEMAGASRREEFEKAGRLRDQIEALENVLSHYARKQPWLFSGVSLKRIEAYDISNIQGKEATGSMVTFINEQPDKNFYRRFKIKIAGKPDDTAMLKEVLSRRFNHPEWPYPDLILIDGGKAQLNAALSITRRPSFLRRVGFRVISLAKRHNELFIEGRKKPILLETLPREIFNLILRLRDEAHRFAIAYHKKLREKRLIQK